MELILEGTFFWEVVDLPAMVKSTGDTSGDLCNHARSQFIRHVARVTLKEFMDSSHSIAKKVWEAQFRRRLHVSNKSGFVSRWAMSQAAGRHGLLCFKRGEDPFTGSNSLSMCRLQNFWNSGTDHSGRALGWEAIFYLSHWAWLTHVFLLRFPFERLEFEKECHVSILPA